MAKGKHNLFKQKFLWRKRNSALPSPLCQRSPQNLAKFRKKIMDDHFRVVLLWQKLYIDCYPFLYKLPIRIRATKGRIHVVIVQRPFDRVQTMIPLLIMVAEMILLVWAASIIGPGLARPAMDVRIWAWSFCVVLGLCGVCIYYLWLVEGKETLVFWANEMLQLELDLKSGKYCNFIGRLMQVNFVGFDKF